MRDDMMCDSFPLCILKYVTLLCLNSSFRITPIYFVLKAVTTFYL